MADHFSVVFATPSPQQAQLLKRLLASRGIQAMVTNDTPEPSSGFNVPTGRTMTGVAVSQDDVHQARQIAQEFQQTLSDDPELAADAEEAVASDLTVIYRAPSPHQAHLLTNFLAGEGIRAVVTNEVLAGGAGVDVVGWATMARVAVADYDAESARRIALEFDETVTAEPDLAADAEAAFEAAEADDLWPRCPQCDARRSTRCPICETAGTEFPRSDPDFPASASADDEAEPASCGCGSGGCSTHGPGHEQAAAKPRADAGEEAETQPEEPAQMLICTTCDEPFVPDYPRICEWCGHEFGDGFAVEPEKLMEPITGRAIAVILALLGLGAALVVYFSYLV